MPPLSPFKCCKNYNTQPVHVSMRPIRFKNRALLLINTQRRVEGMRSLHVSLLISRLVSTVRVRARIPFMAPLAINFTSLLSLPNKEMSKN